MLVNTIILSSTFFLTLLMIVGLFFFIRASTKERSQEVKLLSAQPEELLLTQLQQYFDRRAYRPIAADEQTQKIVFEGFVRPSWFLTIFLTLLAACGFFCLAIVLSVLFPQIGMWFVGLVLISPAAGIFYWQTAGRVERVSLKVETVLDRANSSQNLITVTGHRDELEFLQESLKLKSS
jgi:Flp pilus assembly protein TadB